VRRVFSGIDTLKTHRLTIHPYLNTASPSGQTVLKLGCESCNVMADVLSDDEIQAQLPEGWNRDGDEIVRTFEFDAYLDGVGFAAGAGGVAEDAFHHPEITISWREVEVRLTTHDAGGITEKDMEMAKRLNDIHE
jgi:4a-hydroxytetrahydrobiopterin dehydratase